MGIIPIPAEMYFNDFPDKMSYSVMRDSKLICVADGLTNTDEDGRHIAFLYGIDVQSGDTLSTSYGDIYVVRTVSIDTYNGKPALTKAYY